MLVLTPCLRADPLMRLRFIIVAASWVTIVVSAGGCTEPTGPRTIANRDVNVKIPAMKTAAERKGAADFAQLVKELESDDAAVRLFAIESLERITGGNLGYVYYADREARQPAVERWKQWLAERTN